MQDPAAVGVIANPVSGRDIRRLIASAAHSTLEEKVSIVRRVVIGAAEAGGERFLFLPEPHAIWRRATQTLQRALRLEPVDLEPRYREGDSTRAAELMREAGCAVLVVLGGDGTNRAVARGWLDAPLIPLSTGTNNVFPYLAEPTIAGVVAGLLATGRLSCAEVAEPAKVIHVEVDGEADDLALVDAVALEDRFVGSLMLFEPDRLRTAVLARAEPAAIGLSSVGGLLEPCGAADDRGVVIRFAPARDASARCVRVPTAPGHYADVGVAACDRLDCGSKVEVVGPCLLAFDGERQRKLARGQRARLTLRRDGPRVVDLGRAMALAAERALFRVR
jgi:hypothetical protein